MEGAGWVGEAPGGPAMAPVPQPCAGSSAALGARQNIWCHFSTPWRQFSGPQGSIPLVMGSSWVGAPKIWALANAMPAQEACRGLQAVSTLARQGAGGRLAGWEGVRIAMSHLYSVLHVERNTWALGWPHSDSGWALQPLQQPPATPAACTGPARQAAGILHWA